MPDGAPHSASTVCRRLKGDAIEPWQRDSWTFVAGPGVEPTTSQAETA